MKWETRAPEWISITPLKAKEFLKRNTSNYRLVNNCAVDAYAKDMAAGNWKKNGEPIVFSKNGVLLNGQHRLMAIVKANVPVEMLVVYDADDTQLFDVGYGRSLAQVLRANGIAASPIVTGIVRIIVNGDVTGTRIPIEVANKYTAKNLEIIKKAENIVRTSGSVGRKASCAAIVYCMLKTKEMTEEELRMFFKIINSGNVFDCDRNPSPALVLRRQLADMKGGGQFLQKRQLELTIKALNDFHNNSSRKNNYNCESKFGERLIQEVHNADFQIVSAAS